MDTYVARSLAWSLSNPVLMISGCRKPHVPSYFKSRFLERFIGLAGVVTLRHFIWPQGRHSSIRIGCIISINFLVLWCKGPKIGRPIKYLETSTPERQHLRDSILRCKNPELIHAQTDSKSPNILTPLKLITGRSTVSFCSADASGSTSQAANIQEAIEVGARVLLLDEDSCATNFMIRDARMQVQSHLV